MFVVSTVLCFDLMKARQKYLMFYQPLIEVEQMKHTEKMFNSTTLFKYQHYFEGLKPSGDHLWNEFSEMTFLDQYFNEDLVTNSTWIMAVCFAIVANTVWFKWLVDSLLVWDTIEGDSEQSNIQRQNQDFTLIAMLMENHKMHLVFWYWFMDATVIFPTSFELLFFIIACVHQSFIIATLKTI